jgi:GNAT superfamily N-acetyltransferase
MTDLPDNTIIRRATVEDVPAILSLTTALAEYEQLTPPDAEAGKRLARDIAGEHPRFQAFLAEVDGRAAGYAVAFETYSTFMAEPTYYVEDIFILKDYRGKGIGHAMFSVLAEEALCRGCRRMDWTALDWNQPAIDFYEGLGAKLMKEWRVFRLDTAGIGRLAEESQAFFQREDWQKCERRADEDVREGRVKRFSCAADAAAYLKDRQWKSL